MLAAPEKYDLLVVGGGPAGLAATVEARRFGLSVALVDERPTLGGQVFKQPGLRVADPGALGRDYVRGRRLIEAAERSGARLLLRTACVALDGGPRGVAAILVREGERAREVSARHAVVAAGAHDRPVCFPGWTLPGVLTAGAAQTIVKAHRVSLGERVLFAGSGPLAVVFPAQLLRAGIHVVQVLEAAPAPRPGDILRLARALPGNFSLLRDAARYRFDLRRGGVALRFGRIVVRAEGRHRVEAVVHACVDSDWRVLPGTEERVEADTLCVGYGFLPSPELLRLAGCELGYDVDACGPTVIVDEWMRTTVPCISAAGDVTGVAGSYVAEDEGRLAVLGFVEDERRANRIRRRLARRLRFQAALRRLYQVGPGIFELAAPDTVVCRCEEVTLAELEQAVEATADINVVKAMTRALMGLCQGRSCQWQIAALLAARRRRPLAEIALPTPRAPVRPVPLGAVADETVEDLGLFVAH